MLIFLYHDKLSILILIAIFSLFNFSYDLKKKEINSPNDNLDYSTCLKEHGLHSVILYNLIHVYYNI